MADLKVKPSFGNALSFLKAKSVPGAFGANDKNAFLKALQVASSSWAKPPEPTPEQDEDENDPE